MAPTERAGWLADKICNGNDYAKEAAIVLVKQAEEIERLRGEVAQWKAFSSHCQRVVSAVKTHMTPAQVVEFLGEQIDAKIANLSSCDTSDLDPDLLAYARKILDKRKTPNV
jgi:hypothetical protein